MKNKPIICLSILVVIFSFISFGFYINKTEREMWKTLGTTIDSFQIHINKQEQDSQYILQQITETAEKYEANVYKIDVIKEKDNNILIKSIYISYDTEIIKDIPLIKGDFILRTSKNVLETNNIETPKGKKRTGTIYSFLNIEKVRIQPLENLSGKSNLILGTYTIELRNNEKKIEFVKELSERLNMSNEELTEQKVFVTQDGSFFITLPLILCLIALGIFFLSMIYYLTRNFKKIGTEKLLGNSSCSIWSSILSNIIIAQITTTSLIIFGLKIFTDTSRQYLLQFFQVGLAITIFTLIISLSFLRIIKSYTISDLIKNRKPVKVIYLTNMFIRSVLLILILLLMYFTISSILEIFDEYKVFEKWEDYGIEYSVLKYKTTDEDHSDMIQNTHIFEKKMYDLYPFLNENGAIYSRMNYYKPTRYLMTININYLKEFGIKDEKGNPFNLSENETRGIYLVPESQRKNDNDLKDSIQKLRILNVESSERYYTVTDDKKNKDIQIIYYKNETRQFSFNTEFGKDNNYMIEEPIFEVMTEGNSLFLDRSHLADNGVNSPIKINNISNEIMMKNGNLQEKIKELGLVNNSFSLMSISDVFKEEISAFKLGLSVTLLTSAIILTLQIWVSVQTILMRMSIMVKKISIKKILGYGFFDIHYRDFIVFGISWILIFLITVPIALSNISISKYSLFVAIPLFILDLLVLVIVSYDYGRKNINCSMRGDE